MYRGNLKEKDCGKLELSYGTEQEDQIYKIKCADRGNIIKFSKTRNNLSIFEVVIASDGKGTDKCEAAGIMDDSLAKRK